MVLLLLFAILIMFSTFVSNLISQNNVLNVSNLQEIKNNYSVQKIEENKDSYNIYIYYPKTDNKTLNEKITKLINDSIKSFKANLPTNFKEMECYLDINFAVYNYLDYTSYVFYKTEFLGGAHPNSDFISITYNGKSKKIIDISSLIASNKNLLTDLSKYSYDTLKKNKTITEIGIIDMLESGTKATKDNFSTFALTKSGIMIFFKRYQVAPYVAGDFTVTVPYEEIKLKL